MAGEMKALYPHSGLIITSECCISYDTAPLPVGTVISGDLNFFPGCLFIQAVL